MTYSYKKLWDVLKSRGISKKQLSKETGIGTSTLSDLSSGKNTSLDTIAKIIDYLGCSFTDIVEIIDDNGSNRATESTININNPGFYIPDNQLSEDNAIQFLWEPYILRSSVNFFIGEMDLGKSLLSIDLAARISNGWPLPGDDKPRAPEVVLVCGKEDLDSRQLEPRLHKAGANMSNIRIFDNPYKPNLEDGGITDVIASQNPGLCIIDPITSFVKDASDILQPARLRSIFDTKFIDVLNETKCALLVVVHTTKAGNEDLLKSALGSLDNVAYIRSAINAVAHPDHKYIKLLFHTKANYTDHGKTIPYQIIGGKPYYLQDDDLEDIPSIGNYIIKYTKSNFDRLTYRDDDKDMSLIMSDTRSIFSGGLVEKRDAKDTFMEMGYDAATFLLMRELLDIESKFEDGVEYLYIR